ncbi:hypothetical protein LIA77_01095 [Sarocladium implicatum]|nr:hypothetical protein LIA77_01095 [Sarocladium implicatum]
MPDSKLRGLRASVTCVGDASQRRPAQQWRSLPQLLLSFSPEDLGVQELDRRLEPMQKCIHPSLLYKVRAAPSVGGRTSAGARRVNGRKLGVPYAGPGRLRIPVPLYTWHGGMPPPPPQSLLWSLILSVLLLFLSLSLFLFSCFCFNFCL